MKKLKLLAAIFIPLLATAFFCHGDAFANRWQVFGVGDDYVQSVKVEIWDNGQIAHKDWPCPNSVGLCTQFIAYVEQWGPKCQDNNCTWELPMCETPGEAYPTFIQTISVDRKTATAAHVFFNVGNSGQHFGAIVRRTEPPQPTPTPPTPTPPTPPDHSKKDRHIDSDATPKDQSGYVPATPSEIVVEALGDNKLDPTTVEIKAITEVKTQSTTETTKTTETTETTETTDATNSTSTTETTETTETDTKKSQPTSNEPTVLKQTDIKLPDNLEIIVPASQFFRGDANLIDIMKGINANK